MKSGKILHGRSWLYVLLIVAAALLMERCDEQMTQPYSDTGTIKGRVVDEAGNGLAYVSVELFGAPFSAVSDSLGRYTLYHIPEGEYEFDSYMNSYHEIYFLLSPKIRTIVVEAGKVSTVPDIVYIREDSYPDIRQLTIFTCSHDVLQPTQQTLDQYYSLRNQTLPVYLTNTDCIRLEFLTTQYSSTNETQPTPLILPTSVIHNGDTLYSEIPEKGRVTTPDIKRTGSDTIEICVEKRPWKHFVLYDSLTGHLYDTSDYLMIFAGDVSFQKVSDQSREYIIRDGDALLAVPEKSQTIDWDMYLVNLQTMDTCWWKNPSMNWLEPDSNSGTRNPYFSGDAKRLNSPSSGDFSYSPDKITASSLPGGDYAIYVHFYDGPPDSAQSTPQIHCFMGKTRISGRILAYYQHQADHPLKKGETWCAGRIRYPELLFFPNNRQ